MSSPGSETYRLEAFADAVFAIAKAYAPGSLLYLAATLLAFVHVAISLSIVAGLAILYMFPRAGAHAAAVRASSQR